MNKSIRWAKSYLTNFLVCAMVGIALYLAPSLFTRVPDGVVTISKGSIALTNALNIEEVPNAAWRSVEFPYSVEKNGTKGGANHWIKFEFNDAGIESDTIGVLIKNLPHGGRIYQNGVLIDELPQSTSETQVINFSPVYFQYRKNKLQERQIIEIQSFIGFSFSVIEPVYVGKAKVIKDVYRAYNNWNNTYLAVISSLCACVAFLLIALLRGNFSNRTLRVFTALSLLWPIWLLVTTAEYVPYNLWEAWRILIGILAVSIFYMTVEIVFMVLKRKVPNSLSLFHACLIPIIIFAAVFNDQLLWLSYGVVVVQCFGVVFTIWYVLYLAIKHRSWEYFTVWLFLMWTAIASAHDILSWLGWWPKHYWLLRSIGVPEFWLQSRTVTHLVVFPALLLISVEAVRAIRASFELQLKMKTAAQNERARITMDLHDSLGATLTMGSLQSQNGNLTIDAAKSIISEAMNDLRLILNGFSQDVPDLVVIIETIVEQSKKALSFDKSINIAYSTPYMDIAPAVSAKTAINLSKIMREAVTNAAKYSKSTEISLTLEYLESEILVTIEDNGLGFDVEEKINGQHRGNGLRNMRSRAHESGGRIYIESRPGKTTLSVYMPIENKF